MTAMKWKQVACVECPGLKREITRLRTEVARLKGDLLSLGATETSDGGLKLNMPRYHAAHRCERHRKESWQSQDLEKCVICVERERDEALAQVAVLLREIYDWPHHERTSEQASSVLKRLTAAARNLPAEARALLDRLQQAEAVVEAIYIYLKDEGTLNDLQKKLAAWEEGKA